MFWISEDVLEKSMRYLVFMNKKEELNLSENDLNSFAQLIDGFAGGIADKLNEIDNAEVILRSWVKGIALLSYVRMWSIGEKTYEDALKYVFESSECLFPIIDPRCR